MTDRLLVPNFISVHSGPAPSYNFDDNSASSSSTDNEVDVKPNIQHMTKVYLERSNQCTFKVPNLPNKETCIRSLRS